MRTILISLLASLFLLSSCSKEIKSNITSRSFRLEGSLLAHPYNQLTIPGEFFIVEKNNHGVTMGYAGLILGQSIWGDAYYAYDLACQVEAGNGKKVQLSIVEYDEEIKDKVARCPECETRYLLNIGGAPIGDKDTPALHRYYIHVDRQNDKVIVSN